MAAQRALPFAHVNWDDLVAAFESIRDKPLPSQHDKPGITRWRRVRSDTLEVTVHATMKLYVSNGNGFVQRWQGGDFTRSSVG
jgi:hypothetical protein